MLLSNFMETYVIAVSDNPIIKTFKARNSNVDCLTLKINSLYEYLKIIETFENEHKIDKTSISNQFFYRGVSDKNWKLEPSLAFRNLVSCEKMMVQELKQLRPDEFAESDSNFNLLAKMQHYGLPTRLLDFTSNPLVALYFACCDSIHNNKDGRVFMTLEREFDPALLKFLELACSTYKDLRDKFSQDISLRYDYITVFYGSVNNLFFLKPNYITEREKRQEAVFLIFPNYLYNTVNGDILTLEKGAMWDSGFTNEDDVIVEELDIHDSIMPISRRKLGKHFICIDINNKEKKEIINQLHMLGIKESFVFPELEYTCSTLANKYENLIDRIRKGRFDDKYDL